MSGRGITSAREGKQKQLAQLLNTDGVALVSVDSHGRIQEWNTGASHIFQCARKDMVGKPFKKVVTQEERPRLSKVFHQVKHARTLRASRCVINISGRRKQHGPALLKLHIRPLREEGRLAGFSIAATDISESEERATQLKQANEKLAQSREELQTSYEQLKASQGNLIRSEKLAFAARMAGSVAHEIKNPLGVMMLAIQQLQRELPKQKQTQPLLEAIQQSTERVSRLVNEFVNCTRPQKLRMRRRDIHAIVERLVTLTKPACQKQRINVSTHLDRRLPFVFVDRARIEQAFLNIILNAIQAMPRGGRLSIATSMDDQDVMVHFKDTGPGMAHEHLFRVFDPFFTTKPTGSGLGLAVTYSIVASHNGVIAVESEKGYGAIFTVRLPRHKQEITYEGELALLGERGGQVP